MPPLNRKRKWMFRIIALVVIPILFLGGLELLLRLCGFGYPTAIAIPCQRQGRAAYTHNIKFGWQFFPPNISMEFDGFVFDAEKPPNTCRIFVLGASAAVGFPAAEYSFGRILEVLLNQAYPQTRFEVITVAMPGINSHVVFEMVKDCANYDPDLFILYLGNNEVVGPFGPGTVFAPLSSNLSAIRANIALKTTKIGQLINRILQSVTPREKNHQQRGVLARYLEKQVRYDSPLLETVYNHFEKNMSDICRIGQHSGAQVIVSNVGHNLKDCPPFSSLHRAGLTEAQKQRWQTLYQKAIEHEAVGEYLQAIESYRQAAKIDQTFADLQFRLASNFFQTGEYENARQHYQKALHYDTVRLRADDRINEILRSVANGEDKEGIFFVDTVSILEQNSPAQIPGEELFYEHVHYNFQGNYLLARAIFSKIREVLPACKKQNPLTILTEEQCAQRLAYTNFERHLFWIIIVNDILDLPPFTNQLYHQEFMEKTRRRIEELSIDADPSKIKALGLHEKAIVKKPEDWQLHLRYSILLKVLKNYQAEEIQLRKTLKLSPYNVPVLHNLGHNLSRQGRFTEAQDIFYQLLELKPNSAQAHLELAGIYRKTKDNKKLIKHLVKSISIRPADSVDLYLILAEAYVVSGQLNKAMSTLYDAVEIFPEEKTARLHFRLGFLLRAKAKYEKAYEQMKRALEINPNYTKDEMFRKSFSELEKKNKQ